ncbi:MAG: 16S rRNA processing protein RimM [Oscillospiraceae bacterium]|nr:16S rRNA processing protein RimM [Oscillospiraceae bacterium]
MQKPFLEVGEIVTTHGVTGECKVYPWCDSADLFGRLKKLYWDASGQRCVRVLGVKYIKNMAVLRLDGIETVEDARRQVGKVLYAARGDIRLPKGAYFVQDIVGCRVTDAETGAEYGVVINVTHPANCDIYEIKTPDGSTVLFPAVPEFMGEVDVENEHITVRPIEGMFTECESI